MSEIWTKGPWMAAAKASSVVGLPVVSPTEQGRLIAHVAYGPAGDKFAGYNVASMANARLIAAAPELYEALACFLEDERFRTAVGGNPIAVDRMIDQARAALARARGELS